MPLVAVNADHDRLSLRDGGALVPVLRRAVKDMPTEAPIVVLIHGYRFSPKQPARDPHRHILALAPRRDSWKALSWPRHLGFGRVRADEGVCLSFGWDASGSIWGAWASAGRTGAALADLIRTVHTLGRRPVHIVAHSLGARVALAAMGALPAHSLGRVVLIAGAEFQSTAAAALSSPAGRSADLINVISRENRLFDLALFALIRPSASRDRPLGFGLEQTAGNWIDLDVGCPNTRRGLRGLGFRIPAPKRRVCHWWGYLRPGLMAMYRDLIRNPKRWPLTLIQDALSLQLGAPIPSMGWTHSLKGMGAALASFVPLRPRSRTSAKP